MLDSNNRRVRVFVSSTFRDMMEERDELMTHTWPELRCFCHERQVELVEVDLRWGIAEEQSTRKETLKLCLDEIRACRPFFIGLLGERYGWTPGADAFTADLKEEQAWLKGLHGKSITELEILHGVLNNPEMAARAFFYFRDPKYVESVPPDRKNDFTAENAESAEKQNRLKDLIRQVCAEKTIPLRQNYPNQVNLAALVLEDLKAAIEAHFPNADAPDALTREARDHEAFAQSRRRTYIGRSDYFEALDYHAAGDGAPLVLLGESGSGKSALLANWLAHWHQTHANDFIFEQYIGGTPDSAECWRLMTRLIGEIKRWTDDPDELPKSYEDILKTFPVWLVKARIKAETDRVRCIVVLDALNQLEDIDRARFLGWLPSHPFSGPLRLIVSTLPGDTLNAVTQRGWKSLRVQPLAPDERQRFIEHYLARFGKKLDSPRLKRIAATSTAANPLYLKILLDELRVTGTHERLDERLQDYLATTDIPALLKKLLARYQHDYERDRPGLVSEALGLIWAARRGLTETELLRLLRPSNLPQLPLAIWTPLRSALEEALVNRGGILNFAHDFLRTAVEIAFVPNEPKSNEWRLRLAEDFQQQPVSARNCDELPWLLWQAKQRHRLRASLLEIDRFMGICERDKLELIRYWVWLREERLMATTYLASFEEWSRRPEHPEARVGYAAFVLAGFFSVASLFEDAEPLYRRALAIAEQRFGSDHPNVASALNDLASVLSFTNRLGEAEPLVRRALAIDEKRFGSDHPAITTQLNNLGSLLQATNRRVEAWPFLRRALAILEKNLGMNHPRLGPVLSNLAHLLVSMNRSEEAWPLLQRALNIREQSFGPSSPSVATSLTNLAGILYSTKRFAEAEPLFRKALAINEQYFGKDHAEVAGDVKNLALVLSAINRLADAEPLYRRLLAIEEKTLGSEHPDFAEGLGNLAGLLDVTNRPGEAEPLLRREIRILMKFEHKTGNPHPGFNAAMHRYTKVLGRLGRNTAEISEQLNAIGCEFDFRFE